jgi:hypothetical protein
MKAVIKLNSVVLPAPLGPISPKISCFLTLKDTLFTATKPPKRRVNALASKTILLLVPEILCDIFAYYYEYKTYAITL